MLIIVSFYLTYNKSNDTHEAISFVLFITSIVGLKMNRNDILKNRQALLKSQISKNLDLIVGSVVRSPAMMYHSLTTKVDGKTVTRYIRKGLVPKVKVMTERNRKVRSLIQQLSKINWEILKKESE
jgi:hypothetical protein